MTYLAHFVNGPKDREVLEVQNKNRVLRVSVFVPAAHTFIDEQSWATFETHVYEIVEMLHPPLDAEGHIHIFYIYDGRAL